MQINEFMREVNKVACAVYRKEYDQLQIYTDEDDIDSGAWFLRLVPHSQDVVWGTDWSSLGDMGVERLAKVMELFDKLQHTPVDERFPEKKYYLLTRDNKFIQDASSPYSLSGPDSNVTIGSNLKKRKWTQRQLKEFSIMTGIPMDVIDYWKQEVPEND